MPLQSLTRSVVLIIRYWVVSNFNENNFSQSTTLVFIPDLHQAYILTMKLNTIYYKTTNKSIAITRLAHWFPKLKKIT